MKYPSCKHQSLALFGGLLAASAILRRNLMGAIERERNTECGTRNIEYRNQEPAVPLASDFNCGPSEYSGPFYGILKRSIIGGP